MKLKRALLVVDVQNDFCPGGALGVKDGDKIIPVINKYIKIFSEAKLPIFASRDWHPKKTSHFKKFGGVWPVHCVQGTKGAKFHPGLKLTKETIILSKGMDPDEDSYSAFQAVDEQGKGLSMLLGIFGIKELFVGGLATDYCVKWSVLDALKNDIKTYLLTDAIKGVNLKPTDSDDAIKEMLNQGAKKATFRKVSELIG